MRFDPAGQSRLPRARLVRTRPSARGPELQTLPYVALALGATLRKELKSKYSCECSSLPNADSSPAGAYHKMAA